ncbi:hypothetical protein [Actinacidiphila oryziradicis]|uniref:Uncharacterized protein n=1 Tax=Actinacidiphila oryziradicis TaxID=2571141 RepID=A0A4U0SS10_9ACTN|nr:hypothetical protein FCI23_15020 [Actinacidiphila oryziradicis]
MASNPVVTALVPCPSIEVIMIGGRVRRTTLGTVDQWATDMLRGL